MSFDYNTLITDRTVIDVQSAKNLTQKVKDGKTLSAQEQQLFDNGLKGCYNAIKDLNRVELACEDIVNRLAKDGYKIEIVTKTNWSISDIPTIENMNRIKQNLQLIKDTYCVRSSTPNVPPINNDKITYNEANDIEKILADVNVLINSMEQYYIRCGVARCGQNRVWQHRFRGSKTWNRIPFNTFNDVPEPLQVYTVCNVNDSANIEFKGDGSAYGNVLYYNNSINELDNIIGDVNG